MRNEKNRRVSRGNPLLRDLEIVRKPIAVLRPLGRETRIHPPEQIRHLTESISANGLVLPILIDSKSRVVDGWAIVLAAKQLGLSEIPVVSNADLPDIKLRALRIALNKVPEFSRWNQSELQLEILEILEVEPAAPLGIDPPNLDLFLHGAGADQEDDYSAINEPAEPQCKPGDQFICGEQVIQVGDALSPFSYAKLLGRERADMVFTDPPYNVPIAGHVTKSREHDFAMAKGELSPPEFEAFLATSLGHAARFSRDGSVHFVFMDWRHLEELIAAGNSVFAKLMNICVWNKTNAGMGSLYRSQHEFVFVYKHGTARHINNVNLGRHGRNRTNVWTYVSQSALSGTSKSKLALHPTVKPVAMVADAIRDCSNPRDVILDPFGGAGTTMIAAEKTGRRARLLELNPIYVDVAVQRWQRLTGETAYHADTGQPYGASKSPRPSKRS